jgi:RNA polymerase sigma-70 factor (ECF subfamily)
MDTSTSDEELAALVQKKDETAFATLVARYEGKLLRYGRRFLSGEAHLGDAVQDIFISVWENIQSFDASQRFSPWIYRIAHNAFVDILRQQAKEPIPVFDFDRIIPHPAYDDPTRKEKEKEELRVLIEKNLRKLPPLYREVVDLYYFEDFSYKEIADILHVPLGTVGIRLSRAKEALKKHLTKSLSDHE